MNGGQPQQLQSGDLLLDPLLYRNSSGTGSAAGGAETTIDSFSLPAGTLDVDQKALRITAFGNYANNANVKTVKLYFGATVIATPNAGLAHTGVWAVNVAFVFRTGAATQVAWSRNATGSGGNEQANTNPLTTPAETLASPVLIKVTGAGTSASDVVCKGLIIELLS